MMTARLPGAETTTNRPVTSPRSTSYGPDGSAAPACRGPALETERAVVELGNTNPAIQLVSHLPRLRRRPRLGRLVISAVSQRLVQVVPPCQHRPRQLALSCGSL